ncbi:serine peptidase, family S28, partial [Aspergillus sclerotialis]
MGVYYDQDYRGMIANGYANCVKYIQAALEYIDGQLASNETAAKIKQLFFGVGAETNSNGDFTVALAGIYGFFKAYGTKGPPGSLHDFCGYLETGPQTDSKAGPDGLAPAYGK